jgi:hypothetical protein
MTLMDVRLVVHCGLKSDIVRGPKSAKLRPGGCKVAEKPLNGGIAFHARLLWIKRPVQRGEAQTNERSTAYFYAQTRLLRQGFTNLADPLPIPS